MERYYADTYALVAIVKGDENYSAYVDKILVTTEFNLLELAHALTRDFGAEKARRVLKIIREDLVIIQPTDEDYIDAALLRREVKREGKNLSLIDCLGYVIAKRLNIPFLTGDREFKDMENVEYVEQSRQ
ncbi:MAG: type II toxin-antitoxin system VapC family toxin [Thermoprotei archaeon]|nr:MAG: type II toxin-antitoxin system VapC family toxin [Thermoprotei archaeon]